MHIVPESAFPYYLNAAKEIVAIRNLRPARLPQLGGFGTISQVPQSENINTILILLSLQHFYYDI